MDWQITVIQADIRPVFWGLIRTPPEQREMAEINAAAGRLGTAMQIFDRHLAGRTFVVGDALTMGDIPIGCVCWRYLQLDIARPHLPHVTAYAQRLQARPGLPRARDAAAHLTPGAQAGRDGDHRRLARPAAFAQRLQQHDES